jgi:hypothetical protein
LVSLRNILVKQKSLKPSSLPITKPLNANILELQMCMFKLTMKM